MVAQIFHSSYFRLVIAGMPAVTLTFSDIFRMRLQTISFFIVVILISAWVIRMLWNSLRKEFPRLLPLSYKASLFGTILWGLLFLFVLTMISGVRELMTPGAWKPIGRTYRLYDDDEVETAQEKKEKAQKILEERRQSMRDLRTVLWAEATTHEGKFPNDLDSGNFSSTLSVQPGGLQVKYKYLTGKQISKKQTPLVIEQAIYGDERQFVLYTDGSVELLLSTELKGILND